MVKNNSKSSTTGAEAAPRKKEKTMLKNIALAAYAFIAAFAASAMAAEDSAAVHAASSVVQSGVFEGRNDHITKGGVSIVKTSSGYIAILEGDFSLDGAPSPTLGFGKDGFDKKTEFTKLEQKKGLQVYAIPANINPADYDEFYVWCSDFSIALGVASLK